MAPDDMGMSLLSSGLLRADLGKNPVKGRVVNRVLKMEMVPQLTILEVGDVKDHLLLCSP